MTPDLSETIHNFGRVSLFSRPLSARTCIQVKVEYLAHFFLFSGKKMLTTTSAAVASVVVVSNNIFLNSCAWFCHGDE